jgi:vacuolar-type H+-ATPase subunit I/STV1
VINENEFGGWALHSLRFNRNDFEYIVTELSQRIDSDQNAKKPKRLDGALVVKQNDTYSAIIVELKFNKDAQEALDQIQDKEYGARCEGFLWKSLGIKVTTWYSVGFNLSTTPRKLVTCKHE